MILSADIQKRERKNKVAAYTGTAIFHALCLLGLWYMMLYPPDPPLDAGGSGMAISLGEPDMGGPSEIPVEEPAPLTPTPEDPIEENPVATQDVEDAPVVEAPKETKKNTDIKKKVEPV